MNNFKHTLNYLIGSIGIKALGFISIPFFTHFLGVEGFGMMSLYSTVLSFLSTLLSLGILGSFKRYYFEKTNDFGAFLYTNIMLLFVFFMVFISIYFYFIQDISEFVKLPKSILKYTIFIAFFALIFRIKLDFLQVQEKSKRNIVLEFIQTIFLLILAMCFILYLEENKFLGKIYGDLIGYIILAIYSIYKILQVIQFKFKFYYLKYSLLFGLPVLPSMFSSFGLAFADRLMINNYTNIKDVGLYSFAFMIAMLIQVVILSVGKSWQPAFYKYLSSKEFDKLDNIFLNNTKIVLSASLILIFFSYELVIILSNNLYLESQNIIIFLIFGFNFFFLYTVYGQYNSFVKKTYMDSIITFTSVGINIFLNYIFIPKYGYIASAITTIVSYFVMFILFYLNAKYMLKFKVVDILKPKKIYLLYIIFIIIYFIIQNLFMNFYIEYLLIRLLLISLFLYILFKNEIKFFLIRRKN